MKSLTVAIIGHRIIKNFDITEKCTKEVLNKLIEEENAETFLFSGKGDFDCLCHDVVTDIKKKNYPQLKRVYVRVMYEFLTKLYEEYLSGYFDETYFPYEVKYAGYRAYVKRNQIMIDKCDILVTYYDKDYQPLNGKKSGTKAAVEYATKKHKRIINVNDLKQ